MIDGFRITIRTGIFPNLGACFSRIVLVFSTFSCCWSSRGTFIRVRIHQARNRRFHGKIFDRKHTRSWYGEQRVGLSRIGLSAVSAGFTFIKRFGVRLLESNWNAATRETTVTIAMLLPRPSAFEAVLQTLQLVTFPGKFPEQRAFSTQRRGCLC